jgi:hypothetical protein
LADFIEKQAISAVAVLDRANRWQETKGVQVAPLAAGLGTIR